MHKMPVNKRTIILSINNQLSFKLKWLVSVEGENGTNKCSQIFFSKLIKTATCKPTILQFFYVFALTKEKKLRDLFFFCCRCNLQVKRSILLKTINSFKNTRIVVFEFNLVGKGSTLQLHTGIFIIMRLKTFNCLKIKINNPRFLE